ncbi:MAG: Uma2 family endonuclease [Chloroflexota bacterium]|nr:Uma2 family endonuclease [Chloroflexota bacterium]
MATTTHRMTVEELEQNGGPEGRWELIDGELVEIPPASEKHGRVVMAIGIRVGSFVLGQRLGYVYSSETGFVVSTAPRAVRVPNMSFVRAERLDPDRDRTRFLRVPPDLAVEVISPGDRTSAVLAKAVMWLGAGSTIVWVVDPVARIVTVIRHETSPRLYTRDDTLDGGEILPGFTLAVRDIFLG